MSNAINIDSVFRTNRIGINPPIKVVESMSVIVMVEGFYRLDERLGL